MRPRGAIASLLCTWARSFRSARPPELCASLGAKRIELRTADLRKAESVLSEGAGPDKDIIDVQRFGDRLDLLVRDPDKARKLDHRKAEGAGYPSTRCVSMNRHSKTLL